MTFALTAFRAHGIDVQGPSRKRGIQRMVFEFTALATNNLVSLGNFSGTFWTEVDDSAMGAIVKDIVQNRILPQVAALTAYGSPQLIDRQQRVTAGSGSVTKLDSAASAGGSASETLVVTGLLTTDTILGVSIFEKGAGTATNLAVVDYGDATGSVAVADALPVTFHGDPGAGAKVRVAVLRPSTGDYSVAIQNDMPNISMAASDGETSWVIVTEHELDDGALPVFSEYKA